MITDSDGSSAIRSSRDLSSGWPGSTLTLTSRLFRMTVRCSSMCRWKGCTQPPPPLRISQRLKEFFLGVALYAWPARLVSEVISVVGSNTLPLINHSISPPALPRCSSKISRSSSRLCQFDGSGGRSRSVVVDDGSTELSGASSPMTIFIIGILYRGSDENREEAFHIRPSIIFMVLVSQMTSPFLVGEPSWYLVKSTMCSRRFAGHSSKLSRVIGNGSRPPSSAISVQRMHCWPSSMRYWPCISTSL